MSKNGSRIISFGRYRATDLLLFAVILVAFEVIMFFAYNTWFGEDSSWYEPTRYLFSLMIPITLLVMVRWGWYGVFFAVGDGLLYCLMWLLKLDDVDSQTVLYYVLTYGIGNAFIILSYIMVKFMGYKRIASKWYFTALYAISGWVAVIAGRTAVAACLGYNLFTEFIYADLLSLFISIILLLVMRNLDGMMERQKDYLLRLDKEREAKMVADNFGEKPLEIDEETLKTLNKKGDDLF